MENVKALRQGSKGQFQPQPEERVRGPQSLEPHARRRSSPGTAHVVDEQLLLQGEVLERADQAGDVGLIAGLLPTHHVGVDSHPQGITHPARASL